MNDRVGHKSDDRRHEWSTVHVSNVPLDTLRPQLEAVFSELGPIKKCFVVKGRADAKSTIGFVTFAMPDDAREAAKVTGLQIGENTLKLKIAPNTKLKDRGKGKGEAKVEVKKEEDSGETNQEVSEDGRKKLMRSNPRKARLIIRNLSFKATDKSMREHFSKLGELAEINILKKPDGKMVGCAFIQYTNANHAAKAIKEFNAKPFLGRPVAVDWAVPKEVFKGAQEPKEEEVKDEIKEEDDIKEEPESDAEMEDADVKEEDEDDEDDDDEEDDEDDDDEDDDSDDDEEEEEDDKPAAKPRVPHNLSTGHDIDEGKTVFIKNLAYETDEEDLRDMMQDTFGPVYFAKLVLDKVMQHPRGTGFVKFKSAEDAAKCVEVSEGKDGVYLDKRRLNICLAIKQGDVAARQKERKEKEVKDSRNLYLAREGMIREGTQAAVGVSASDLLKRKQVDKYKKNMLKNLNMFVSDTRLCIRNVPVSYDDKKLRKLFTTHAPKGAKITEAKVIRDNKKMENGVGVSKEYGFVTFQQHDDALGALRNINNNPEIFGTDKRPIVDFSIENRKAIQARQKREEKSKLNNPNFKGNPQGNKADVKKVKKSVNSDEKSGKSDFAGTLSDPKVKTLPKHSGAKVRHNKPKITRKDLKRQELERKNPKKRKLRQENPPMESSEADEPKKKKSKKAKKITKAEKRDEKENKAFENLVNQYKNKFASNQQVLKKWFET